VGYAWVRDTTPGKDSTTEDEKWIEGIAEGKLAEREVVVDDLNWTAFTIFVNCATQWRIIPSFGGPPTYQGIEYSSLASVMDMLQIADRPTVFQRVHLMERGAISARLKIPLDDLIWPEI